MKKKILKVMRIQVTKAEAKVVDVAMVMEDEEDTKKKVKAQMVHK